MWQFENATLLHVFNHFQIFKLTNFQIVFMSVLIFIDQADGHIKKASFEVLSYGAKVAEQLGTNAEGVVLGAVKEDLSALGKYGVKKIHHVANEADRKSVV